DQERSVRPASTPPTHDRPRRFDGAVNTFERPLVAKALTSPVQLRSTKYEADCVGARPVFTKRQSGASSAPQRRQVNERRKISRKESPRYPFAIARMIVAMSRWASC